jgi:Domain of unknown function (DUF1772)
MALLIVSIVATGLFAGAAAYVTAVEHPARMSCGAELAIKEFGPSYKRGAAMQASLAVIGSLAGLGAAWLKSDVMICVAALLLGIVVPFTLVVILPTNKRLLDSALDPRSSEALRLLRRWGQLHAVRTVLSIAAFLILLLEATIGASG